MTPDILLKSWAEKKPAGISVITSSVTLSYQEFYQKICSARANIRARNINPQSRIAVISENSLNMIIALYAAWCEGHTVAPLSYREPIKSLGACIEKLSPSLVLLSDSFPALQSLPHVHSLEMMTDTVTGTVETESMVTLDTPATVIFTSGSTGDPKGILHSFGNHYYSALGANENMPLVSDTRWLLSLPLFHVGGLAILFRTLLAQATIVIPDKLLSLPESIKRFDVSHISVVPTQFREILSSEMPLPSLKAVLVGGASLADELLNKAVQKQLQVYKTYGSTEAASQLTTTKPHDSPDKLRTSGCLLPYREMLLSAANEILIRGKTLAANTLEEPLAVDPQGWYHTGDIGRIDADGYLHVMGRKDNMFISGGENIYPEEIEKQLYALLPECESIVVPIPDRQYGYRPVAFIKGEFDIMELEKRLCIHLPKYKIPDQFFAWPDTYEATGIKPSRTYFIDQAIALVENN